MSATIKDSELLKDREILNEINRYKWLESEKAGSDIGIERASREWITKYSKAFFATHPNKTFLLWLKSDPLVAFLNKKICYPIIK